MFTALSAEPKPDTTAWPSFRGPNGSGVATTARPPAQPSPTNGVRWSVEIPRSPSSPVVTGERLFLTTVADGRIETRCYGTVDGRLLWSHPAPADQFEEFHAADGSPAASTPATDGSRVVSYFGSSGLVCHDLDGKELWRQPLPLAQTHGGFGSGTSPILSSGKVFLSRDVANGSTLVAFDAATGARLWETPRPESISSYGTPILWSHEDRAELIVAGSVDLRAYDAGTGLEQWRVTGLPAVTCTTPVVGDGFLFFAGWSPGKADAPFPSWEETLKADKNGDGWLSVDEVEGGATAMKSFDFDKNGRLERSDWDGLLGFLKRGDNVLLAIKPGGKGDVTATHIAWKNTRGLPYVPSPLYYDGRVYLVKDGGLMSSFDARTGEAAYVQERLPDAAGAYYSSPVAADGRIYLASRKGRLTVVKAGGKTPEILHQADFGEGIDATPALAGDRLYLRTKTKLYALGPG